MIRINLLPDEMKRGGKAKRTASRKSGGGGGGGFIVFLAALMMASGAGAFGYLMIFQPYYSAEMRLTKAKTSLTKLEKEVQQKREAIGDLAEIEKIARNQLEVLTILDPPDRLLWSEKLNLLSDLRPSNVYIRKIMLTETAREIETAESQKARAKWDADQKKGKAKGKKPDKVTRPQITQNLTISGISRPPDAKANDADEQAIQSFLDFQTALRDHKISDAAKGEKGAPQHSFMHGFEGLRIGDWKKEKVAGRWVIAFEFTIKTKPLFKQENDESDSDTVASSN